VVLVKLGYIPKVDFKKRPKRRVEWFEDNIRVSGPKSLYVS